MPDEFNPPAGRAEVLEPGLRRVLAPNPSPMTYRGTNTYLLGDKSVAVIDPGPLNNAHLSALLDAVGPDARVTHIIVTHSHKDHSPLAAPLSKATGAPVLAFGGPHAGRSAVMSGLSDAGMTGGGEGVDLDFEPDVLLGDGDRIAGDGWTLDTIHTPGHLGNHICLRWGDACFTGDHVMGWASSLVSPPDGDLTDFMASCEKLRSQHWRVFHPGHGDMIPAPHDRLDWLVTHRRGRERALLDCLAREPLGVAGLTERVYKDTPAELQPAAERNVLAHLIDLLARFEVETEGNPDFSAIFRLPRNTSQ